MTILVQPRNPNSVALFVIGLVMGACGETSLTPSSTATQGGSTTLSDAIAGRSAMSSGSEGSTAPQGGRTTLSEVIAGRSATSSGSEGSTPSAGAGTSTSSTSVSSGGSGPLTPEQLQAATDACINYLTAQCTRRSQCVDSAEAESMLSACMSNRIFCPALFLAPGSGYTVDSLNACAIQWQTFSCSDLSAGKAPACMASGKRESGAPCRLYGQCASGFCSDANETNCGKCLASVEPGAPCETSRQCPYSYICSFGRCQQLQALPPSDALPDGSPCNYDGKCSGACASSSQGDRCVAAPKEGQPCLADLSQPAARNCIWGTVCNSEKICVSPAKTGQACTDAPVPCYASFCNSANGLAPGICTPWKTPGDVCDPAVRQICGEHNQCICDDATCSTAHCVTSVSVGAQCDAYTRCSVGAVCTAGKCVAVQMPFWPPDCV